METTILGFESAMRLRAFDLVLPEGDWGDRLELASCKMEATVLYRGYYDYYYYYCFYYYN